VERRSVTPFHQVERRLVLDLLRVIRPQLQGGAQHHKIIQTAVPVAPVDRFRSNGPDLCCGIRHLYRSGHLAEVLTVSPRIHEDASTDGAGDTDQAVDTSEPRGRTLAGEEWCRKTRSHRPGVPARSRAL